MFHWSRSNTSELSLGGIFLLVHLFPFFYFRQTLVLGFDTGFYRRYLIEPLSSIPHASVPGLDHTVIIPRIFLDLVRFSGLPTDIVLYGSYILAALFLLFAFYRFARHVFGSEVALCASVLLLLAPVYYHGYWFFLLKNFLALGMVFLLFLSIRFRFLPAVILLSLLIPITHQSTTVLVGIMLFVMAGLQFVRRGAWHIPLLSWVLLTALYLVYHPTVASKIAAPPSAVFLDWPMFLLMSAPLVLLGLWGIWLARAPLMRAPDLSAFGIVAFLFPLFSLPYHERVFFFSVFFLALFGGYALTRMKRKGTQVGILIVLALYAGYFATQKEPYFDRETEHTFASLEALTADDHVITPNYVAPWAHGYTTAEVYAPGVFKDPFSPHDWERYWAHDEPAFDYAFLDSYPQPLYFFLPDTNTYYFLPDISCVELVATALYRYTCYNQDDAITDARAE